MIRTFFNNKFTRKQPNLNKSYEIDIFDTKNESSI